MIPSVFVAIEKLPLTSNNKIDRKALSELNESQAQVQFRQQEVVGPRTPLELHVKQHWERILGISGIGMRDNFFELGGHSLLAIRLITELNRSLHSSFPVPEFARTPTIEGMAGVLQRESYARGESRLVPLKPGQTGGCLFFLGTGLAECRIAEFVDSGPATFATWVPVSRAVRAAASDARAPIPRLEDLAAPHTSLILSHAPSGPCFLAGYSFHGLLAFEVAHQLRRKGFQVELVLLVDCWARTVSQREKLKALPLTRTFGAMKSSLLKLAERSSRRAADSAARDLERMAEEMPWDVLRRISAKVLRNYSLRNLDVRAVLFRTLDDERSPYHAIDQAMGWGDAFARGLTVVDLHGHHKSILEEPNIRVFAQRFAEHLSPPSSPNSKEVSLPVQV
jgi:thioesterase domain-containing protein